MELSGVSALSTRWWLTKRTSWAGKTFRLTNKAMVSSVDIIIYMTVNEAGTTKAYKEIYTEFNERI